MKRVNIEQARNLKELGFDKETDYSYVNHFNGQETETILFNGNPNWDDMIRAPYIAEALEWISNEKEIYCSVELVSDCWYCPKWYNIELDCMIYMPKDYKLYEEAESALLDELLIILEESK